MSIISNALPPPRYAGQRIFRHHDRNAGFFHQQAIEVAQQRAAAGQDHATFGNVGGQFWRALLQRNHHRADDAGQRLLQGFEDFIGVQGKAARYAFGRYGRGLRFRALRRPDRQNRFRA